jgi:hypothetical protein
MQDNLYLRISQKEPWDILYFTPAVTWIYKLDDKSFSLSPEVVYTVWTNWEFRLKGTFLFEEEVRCGSFNWRYAGPTPSWWRRWCSYC